MSPATPLSAATPPKRDLRLALFVICILASLGMEFISKLGGFEKAYERVIVDGLFSGSFPAARIGGLLILVLPLVIIFAIVACLIGHSISLSFAGMLAVIKGAIFVYSGIFFVDSSP